MINKICQKVNLEKTDTDFIEVYHTGRTKFVKVEIVGDKGVYTITIDMDRVDKDGTEKIYNRALWQNFENVKGEVEKIERCIRFIKEFL